VGNPRRADRDLRPPPCTVLGPCRAGTGHRCLQADHGRNRQRPAAGVAYGIYFIVLISVRFGAAHVVSNVVWHPPQLLAQLLFTPLLALWAIWVGIGISTRASDVRVAQQLATLASLPLLGFTSLVSFQIITPSVPLAIGCALGVAAIDLIAWRVVSKLFDRERLITGHSAPHDAAA
jgi:hypothetical protein